MILMAAQLFGQTTGSGGVPGGALVAPGFFPRSIFAGPYLSYFDDFLTTNGMTAQNISSGGTQSGQSCAASTVEQDNTSPGNIAAVSGVTTGSNSAGIVCVGAGGVLWLYDAATAPSWIWETRVNVPVLPGTTAASYQAGMAHTWAASPWVTSAIGFYLSSANGTANNWYCELYAGSTSTITNSTIAATAATWTRLTLTDDGTYVHWWINGAEATACKTAVASVPITAISTAFSSWTSAGTTSVTMAIDYWLFQEQVTR